MGRIWRELLFIVLFLGVFIAPFDARAGGWNEDTSATFEVPVASTSATSEGMTGHSKIEGLSVSLSGRNAGGNYYFHGGFSVYRIDFSKASEIAYLNLVGGGAELPLNASHNHRLLILGLLGTVTDNENNKSHTAYGYEVGVSIMNQFSFSPVFSYRNILTEGQILEHIQLISVGFRFRY